MASAKPPLSNILAVAFHGADYAAEVTPRGSDLQVRLGIVRDLLADALEDVREIEQAEAKADKARKMFRVVGNDPEAENNSSDGADKPV